MASFTDRMIGAAKLNVHTYEEVEADTGATGQAMGVVLLSSLAAGIGFSSAGLGLFFAGSVAALIRWVAWAFLTYIIGTRLFPEPRTRADVGELMRTTGFAQAPGLLFVFGIIPVLGTLVRLVVPVWWLVAMVIAVRQALDYQSTGRAVGVVLTGWVVSLALAFFIQLALGSAVS